MKNLFGTKKRSDNPALIVAGELPKTQVIPENVAEGANMEDVKKGYAVKTDQITEPQWKSFNGNSCGDVTNFLNENKVDPLFMIPSTNGQIRVFYKA